MKTNQRLTEPFKLRSAISCDRKSQRTKSGRRVGVAPLTRRRRASAGRTNSPARRRIQSAAASAVMT